MNTLLKIIYTLLICTVVQSIYGQKTSFSKMRVSGPEAKTFIDSAQRIIASNPSKSFSYIEKALQISISKGDKKSEAECYRLLGYLNKNLGQYDLAINYYQKAENQYKANNDTYNLYKVYMDLGDTYYLNKNYSECTKYYLLCQKHINKTGTMAQKIDIKNKIASVYQASGQENKAIAEYSDVLEMEESQNNTQGYISTQNKLGEVYQQTNQNQKALATYKKSEKKAKSAGDDKAVVSSLKKQGEVLRSNEAYDEELKVRNEILQIGEKNKDLKVQSEENLEIGNILVKKDQTKEAIPYIHKSIEFANETGDLEQKGKALQSLSYVYSSNAEYNKALEIYKLYVETKDAIHRKKEQEIKDSYNMLASLNKQIQRLDLIEKELELSEQTISLLKQEQTVNARSLKAQKTLSISMITALLVVTLASIWIFRSNLEKRKANQMLALRSLRSQMNPHFIYNSLNSVNNYISKSDEKSANKFLSDFSRLMRAVMDNSKHDFVPLSSEIQILDVYLKLEHSRFNDKFDYQFNIEPDLETEQYQVPPMLIQPFIENAIWHGLRYRTDKGLLTVSLGKEKDSIKVIIEDNGIGRKKSEELKTKNQKEHASTGLKNIENRINIINQLYKAKIGLTITDLDDNNQTGTRVILNIPVKHESSIA